MKEPSPKVKKIVEMTILAVFVAGISISSILNCSTTEKVDIKQTSPWKKIKVSRWDSVYEVTLSDGTRCAVFKGHEKGGIDCEWKTNPPTGEKED